MSLIPWILSHFRREPREEKDEPYVPGKPRTYIDEMYCDVCEEDTKQKIHESGHERDSSGDWQECLKCRSIRYGMSGQWERQVDKVQEDLGGENDKMA